MNDESWSARIAEDRARLSRRQMLIGGSFLVAATAGLVLKPRRALNMLGSAKLEDLVPKQLGGWRFNTASGLVLPPADQLRDQIYNQLLTRVYVRDDRPPVMMLIAEGMHLRTGDRVWLALARRWSKAFAILFAVGAVSGTIISFELGLLCLEPRLRLLQRPRLLLELLVVDAQFLLLDLQRLGLPLRGRQQLLELRAIA